MYIIHLKHKRRPTFYTLLTASDLVTLSNTQRFYLRYGRVHGGLARTHIEIVTPKNNGGTRALSMNGRAA